MNLSAVEPIGLYPGAIWVHAIGGLPWLASLVLAFASVAWLLALRIFRQIVNGSSFQSERMVCIVGQVLAALIGVLALVFFVHEMVIFYPGPQPASWQRPIARYLLLTGINYFAPEAIAIGALEMVRRKFKEIERTRGA